tara:strand:+ start:1342 stop:1572 length:231 start_codon:yes stop_codon:yes gene_type:complete
MKIGDLVVLSEYGIARDFNRQITHVDPYQLGIVIKYNERASYPFRVKWLKSTQNPGLYNASGHARRELKFAKKRKQ